MSLTKIFTSVFAFSVLTGGVNAQTTKLNTQVDSVSYAIGLNIGANLKSGGATSINSALVAEGIKDMLTNGKTFFNADDANNIIKEYFTNLQKNKLEANIKAGQKFLEENKKKPGVVTLPSGLQYQVLKEGGKGAKPAATDSVKTHYHGMLLDGTVFDSSVQRNEPITFPLNQVIPGWTEALQLMTPGAKWKLFIPSNLAYGEQGAGEAIPPNSTLIFEVELLEVKKAK